MLSRVSPFAWVSFAMMTGVMSTALISPLYPLYKEVWQLQTSDISSIYVAYMVGALLCLLFLGRVPDRIGFKKTMVCSLSVSFVGTMGTMLAWDLTSICVFRFLVGISSTLMTSSAAKGLMAVAQPHQENKVPLMCSFLLAFGFGLGPLVGGAIGQWLPHPLITGYIPSLILSVLALWQLKPIHDKTAPHRLPHQPWLTWADCQPKLTWTDRNDRWAFALICSFSFMAFAVFGLYASLSPLFVDKLIPWHGPFVSGMAIAAILLMSAVMQVWANRFPAERCGMWGMLTQAACSLVLLINLKVGATSLFILGVILAAGGHAMCLLPSMTIMNRIAPPAKQTGLFASYLVIGYIGSILPSMGLGYMADHWGLDTAVSIFCIAVMLLGGLMAWAVIRHPRMKANTIS